MSFERNWEKKDLRFVLKYFFFLKEHRARNFDSLCILMGTSWEEEAHLYELAPRYCHDGHHSSDIKAGGDLGGRRFLDSCVLTPKYFSFAVDVNILKSKEATLHWSCRLP